MDTNTYLLKVDTTDHEHPLPLIKCHSYIVTGFLAIDQFFVSATLDCCFKRCQALQIHAQPKAVIDNQQELASFEQLDVTVKAYTQSGSFHHGISCSQYILIWQQGKFLLESDL